MENKIKKQNAEHFVFFFRIFAVSIHVKGDSRGTFWGSYCFL